MCRIHDQYEVSNFNPPGPFLKGFAQISVLELIAIKLQNVWLLHNPDMVLYQLIPFREKGRAKPNASKLPSINGAV